MRQYQTLVVIFVLSSTLSILSSPIYSDQTEGLPLLIQFPSEDLEFGRMANVKRQLKAFAEPSNTRKLNAMSMMRALINLRRY